MKVRKGILSILIISLISIILGVTATKVNAAVANTPLYLGIEEYRIRYTFIWIQSIRKNYVENIFIRKPNKI